MVRPESPSSIELYHSCPLAYKLKYIEYVPSFSFPYLHVGKVFHELAAEYALYCLQNAVPSDRNHLEELVSVATANLPIQQREDLYQLCRDLVRVVFPVKEGKCLIEHKMGITTNLTPCAYDDPNCLLRGITDFAVIRSDRIEFWDYKTSYRVPSASAGEMPLQAAAYAVLLGLLYPGKSVEAVFRYVRYGVERRWHFEPDQIFELSEYLKNVINNMQNATEYPARISNNCDRCGFAFVCPELEKLSSENTPPLGPLSPEEAVKLAKQYRALQVKLKMLEEKLRRYCENNGPIVLENETLGYRTKYVRRVCSPRTVFTILKQAGINEEEIWQIVSIPVRDLESLLKRIKDKSARELIMSCIETEQRFEFSWSKNNSPIKTLHAPAP